MLILKANDLLEAEREWIKNFGTSSAVLMERAALCLYKECLNYFRLSLKAKILILAGKGNNGGDGLALARLFHLAGYHVAVVIISSKCSKLTQIQKRILKKLRVSVTEASDIRNIPNLDEFDIIIDALLGIGANRPADGIVRELIRISNLINKPKMSIDIPSGLIPDIAEPQGEVFLADLTVALTSSKICHHLYPAKAFCGKIVICDIGIPKELLRSSLTLLTKENTLPPKPRNMNGHKNDYGHVAVIGGSSGKSGAPILAAQASMRTGAGLVSVILPKGLEYAIGSFPYLMSFFAGDRVFSEDDTPHVINYLKENMTIALGMGLSRFEGAMQFTRNLIKNWMGFFIIDADAIYALDEDSLRLLSGRAVLTPHIGEFAKLTGEHKDILFTNRLEISWEYAIKYNIFLMLKNSEIILSAPNGEQYISEWGTPALSKAGTGDILAGITASLIAQGFKPIEAMKTACMIQGKASKNACINIKDYAVIPEDIIKNIGLLNKL